MRVLALLATLFTFGTAKAEDWSGKFVKPKEAGVKLSRKVGDGLVREGEALDVKKTYAVKSDDGTFLELADGYIFKFEAELAASPFPKEWKKDPVGEKPTDRWAYGTKVLPTKRTKDIPFGDWVDGKQVFFVMTGIMPMEVRKDNGDGWVRIHDGHQEGWVEKTNLISKEDAPIFWDKALKANPKDTWALYMRGNGWWQKAEHDNAIADYNECIRLEPAGIAYYNARGNAYARKKEYDKAISDYSEAIRLDPKSAYYYGNRGISWRGKKEYDKAISDYSEAIRLDPKYALYYNYRGSICREKKEYDRSISDHTEAIRLDPKSTSAHYSRSISQLLSRKPGISGFQEVLKLEEFKGSRSPYGVIHGYFAAMLEGDKKVAQAFLDDSKGKLNEAWPYPIVRLLRKEFTEAELLKLATDTDKKTEVYCALGYLELIAGNPAKAKEHFTWVKDNGTSTFTEYTMAIAELDRLAK